MLYNDSGPIYSSPQKTPSSFIPQTLQSVLVVMKVTTLLPPSIDARVLTNFVARYMF